MVENLPASAGDWHYVSDPWVRKILWRGNGNPLQYSCLGNPLYRGTWWATVCEAHESIGSPLSRPAVLTASPSNKLFSHQSTVPGPSGGQSTELAVPTLTLLSILNKLTAL